MVGFISKAYDWLVFNSSKKGYDWWDSNIRRPTIGWNQNYIVRTQNLEEFLKKRRKYGEKRGKFSPFHFRSGDLISGDATSGDIISGDITILTNPPQILIELC